MSPTKKEQRELFKKYYAAQATAKAATEEMEAFFIQIGRKDEAESFFHLAMEGQKSLPVVKKAADCMKEVLSLRQQLINQGVVFKFVEVK